MFCVNFVCHLPTEHEFVSSYKFNDRIGFALKMLEKHNWTHIRHLILKNLLFFPSYCILLIFLSFQYIQVLKSANY